MKTRFSILLSSLAAAAIACGGSSSSVSNDKDAAQAAYNLRNTSHGLSEKARSNGLRAAQNVGVEPDRVTVRGASGEAVIVTNSGVGIFGQQTITYVGYSEDGETTLDGEVVIGASEGAGGLLDESLRGTVTVSGATETTLELTLGMVVDAGEAAAAAAERAIAAARSAEAAAAAAQQAAEAAAANAADAAAQAALAAAQADLAAQQAAAAAAQAEVAAASAVAAAASVTLTGSIIADGVSYDFSDAVLELAGGRY